MIFFAIEITSTAVAIGVMVRLLDSWGGLPLVWWQWALLASIYGALANLAGTITRFGKDPILIQQFANAPLLMAWRACYTLSFGAASGAIIVGLVAGTALWFLFT